MHESEGVTPSTGEIWSHMIAGGDDLRMRLHHWEKHLRKSIWNTENLYKFYSLREFFFAIKKNTFGSNVYFFTLKTLLFELSKIFFLIVNTCSLRL